MLALAMLPPAFHDSRAGAAEDGMEPHRVYLTLLDRSASTAYKWYGEGAGADRQPARTPQETIWHKMMRGLWEIENGCAPGAQTYLLFGDQVEASPILARPGGPPGTEVLRMSWRGQPLDAYFDTTGQRAMLEAQKASVWFSHTNIVQAVRYAMDRQRAQPGLVVRIFTDGLHWPAYPDNLENQWASLDGEFRRRGAAPHPPFPVELWWVGDGAPPQQLVALQDEYPDSIAVLYPTRDGFCPIPPIYQPDARRPEPEISDNTPLFYVHRTSLTENQGEVIRTAPSLIGLGGTHLEAFRDEIEFAIHADFPLHPNVQAAAWSGADPAQGVIRTRVPARGLAVSLELSGLADLGEGAVPCQIRLAPRDPELGMADIKSRDAQLIILATDVERVDHDSHSRRWSAELIHNEGVFHPEDSRREQIDVFVTGTDDRPLRFPVRLGLAGGEGDLLASRAGTSPSLSFTADQRRQRIFVEMDPDGEIEWPAGEHRAAIMFRGKSFWKPGGPELQWREEVVFTVHEPGIEVILDHPGGVAGPYATGQEPGVLREMRFIADSGAATDRPIVLALEEDSAAAFQLRRAGDIPPGEGTAGKSLSFVPRPGRPVVIHVAMEDGQTLPRGTTRARMRVETDLHLRQPNGEAVESYNFEILTAGISHPVLALEPAYQEAVRAVAGGGVGYAAGRDAGVVASVEWNHADIPADGHFIFHAEILASGGPGGAGGGAGGGAALPAGRGLSRGRDEAPASRLELHTGRAEDQRIWIHAGTTDWEERETLVLRVTGLSTDPEGSVSRAWEIMVPKSFWTAAGALQGPGDGEGGRASPNWPMGYAGFIDYRNQHQPLWWNLDIKGPSAPTALRLRREGARGARHQLFARLENYDEEGKAALLGLYAFSPATGEVDLPLPGPGAYRVSAAVGPMGGPAPTDAAEPDPAAAREGVLSGRVVVVDPRGTPSAESAMAVLSGTLEPLEYRITEARLPRMILRDPQAGEETGEADAEIDFGQVEAGQRGMQRRLLLAWRPGLDGLNPSEREFFHRAMQLDAAEIHYRRRNEDTEVRLHVSFPEAIETVQADDGGFLAVDPDDPEDAEEGLTHAESGAADLSAETEAEAEEANPSPTRAAAAWKFDYPSWSYASLFASGDARNRFPSEAIVVVQAEVRELDLDYPSQGRNISTGQGQFFLVWPEAGAPEEGAPAAAEWRGPSLHYTVGWSGLPPDGIWWIILGILIFVGAGAWLAVAKPWQKLKAPPAAP